MTSNTNPLWDLLLIDDMNEEHIMSCMDDHPEFCTLRVNDSFPIHKAIESSCSISIAKKMLSCYPSCCSIKDLKGDLLLHFVLQEYRYQISSSSDIIYAIIDTHPDAVSSQNYLDNLPLHLECSGKCRYEIIVKLLDIFPDAIHIPSRGGNLPLYLTLCSIQSTPIIISYLISRYPAAVSIVDSKGMHLLSRVLGKYYRSYVPNPYFYPPYSSKQSLPYKAIALDMINVFPQALYLPAIDPYIDSKDIQQDPMKHRLLLNLASHHLLPSSSKHIHDCHDMNYHPRSPLLHLIHRLSLSSNHHIISASCSYSSQLQRQRKSSIGTNIKLHASLYGVLGAMLEAAGRMAEDGSISYGWMQGDDLGCILLRNIVLCL